MNRHVIVDGNTRYSRISKSAARNLFDAGKPFYIIAVKMRPGFPFSMGMTIDSQDHLAESGTFDSAVNNFEFYNANCHETGTYSAFYEVS
jgi:hypothetical protein